MKIAITGGAGFIGTHVTRAYLDAGHDVLVIDNLCHGNHHTIDPRARFHHIDIRDEKLRTILQHERPDVVSHHVTQIWQDYPFTRLLPDADVHIRGLLHVLHCCVEASVSKFIYISSGNGLYAAADMEQLPLAESATLQPQLPVDISKATGEWYVRYCTQAYGLKHTILRYADVYGETDPTRITPTAHPLSYFISMLNEERRPVIRGSGEDMRDHIYIDDVVKANICTLQRGENQTLHISSGHGYTQNQLYRMVALLMKSKQEPVYISGSLAEAVPVALDNTLAQQKLGWQPTIGLTEGLRRMIAALAQRREQPEPAIAHVRKKLAPVVTVQYAYTRA
jgi:UDP-glucose 4-epimerase